MPAPTRTPWPFADPENFAAFTTTEVFRDREAILFVTHDAEDGAWQFIGPAGASLEQVMVVCLREVLEVDPTLRELADLPRGWQASRSAAGSPWVREPISPSADDEV